MDSVAAFTDTYLPTVNGVTYTVRTWRDRWLDRGGEMEVVYPRGDGYDPVDGEHPVRSLPFPFYEGFRLGVPSVPSAVGDPDVVHAHTPFSLGIAARRYASRRGAPLVASYHTPTGEYAGYLAGGTAMRGAIRRVSRSYERWFFGGADAVVAPTAAVADWLADRLDGAVPIHTVSNGVDVERFRPVDDAAFRERYGLGEGTLVGYTGRHGHEKCLDQVPAAVDGLDRDVTLVFGGDGPARDALAAEARSRGLDARFLGFLDRTELPAFYSALSAFLFPSPVETQGLVALEAAACGTPVAGVDSGALSETVVEGEIGYRYPRGDVAAFRETIERVLDEYDSLREGCLDARDAISVDRSVDELAEVYAAVA